MASDRKRIVAVITYENGHRITWACSTVENAVKVWHQEMTLPQNAYNPAVAVEWVVGEPNGTDGVVIGAMKRPDPPRNEAWASVCGVLLYDATTEARKGQ